ncbi:MAG: hypothetical protein QOE58_3445 [Actinomycetota bacterium]|jgi:uncharacterized membrane protein YdbT with pleckstrin-like domain|nr:hypothetical protein [Actinomycetota bacterium]
MSVPDDEAFEPGPEPPPPPTRPASRYLLPTERTVVSVRRHWAMLVPAFAEGLLALFVAGWVSGKLAGTPGPVDDVVWLAALAVFFRFVWKALEWAMDRFVVTDARILLTSGLLTRRVAMMPLRKVTDMTYERSLSGRLCGYGTFVMESAGQDQSLRTIHFLPSPDRLYRQVSDLLFGPEASRQRVVFDTDSL